MQATEPNIPAIVEQIAEQFQGQPRDRFARIMQEIAQRLEVEAMEAECIGPESYPPVYHGPRTRDQWLSERNDLDPAF